MSPHELSVPAEQRVRLHDQAGRGQTLLREAEGGQQQGQLLQTAVSKLPAQMSLHDQQLLAEEQDLALLVTQEQTGHQRVDGRKEEQVEVVEHGREGRRGEEGGQDRRRRHRWPSSLRAFLI